MQILVVKGVSLRLVILYSMLIFNETKKLEQHLSTITADKTIGFVPTMGALHEGHLSLIKNAQKENDIVIVSIFVNPTQFDKKSDLKRYPRTIDQDISLLKSVNTDILFTPEAADIYNKNIKSESFDFDGLDKVMEGAFREGHFDGVGTIVKRFLEIVKPKNAYFGEKDFQQLQIIKKLVEKKTIPVNIVGCEILREKDGLAMSSRNVLLSKTKRETVNFIYKILSDTKSKFNSLDIKSINSFVTKSFKRHPELKLEYFQIVDEETLLETTNKEKGKTYRAFIAVFADNIRLIDNIKL